MHQLFSHGDKPTLADVCLFSQVIGYSYFGGEANEFPTVDRVYRVCLVEIVAVDGIDVFFVGPSDLSQSMGYPGDPKAPPVAKAINTTLRRIKEAGRTPGMPAATGNVANVVGAGCLYIYTHLPKLLRDGAETYLKAGCGKAG
jgi:hypothetical protein